MSTVLEERKMEVQSFDFIHGLGDVSNFARLIPVYKKYGIDVHVHVTSDKGIIINAAGGIVLNSPTSQQHRWYIQHQNSLDRTISSIDGWQGNKIGTNITSFGLENKAERSQLWKDLKEVDIQLKELIPQQDWDIVEYTMQDWPRPITLWHSIGNTNRSEKSLNPKQQAEFLYEFIDRTDGTLLILDWDSRAVWTSHHRIKHLIPEFGSIGLSRLAALMYKSDLMIGVDSGPFYFSALTSIPSVGMYMNQLHPAEYMIPLNRALTLTYGNRAPIDNVKRFEFQLIDDGQNMNHAAEWCSRMLQDRRYCSNFVPKASDVQLQQLVQKKCRGVGRSGGISTIYDRHRSFDILLSECKKRFPIAPNFVETGCIRASEDWAGAGFSTALFGRYVQLQKGTLTSFDLSEKNAEFSNKYCKQFGERVKTVCSRGDDGLKAYNNPIHVLYLDSLDTEAPNHQECNLEEFKAAESKLHDKAIVIIDDTPNESAGKGGLTVKYMKEKGWKYLYRGYQIVMSRTV